MKIAIDCRMSGLSGVGVYFDNVVEQWIRNRNEHSYVLFGKEDTLHRFASKSNVRIIETHLDVFSWKELFLFPSKEVNRCDVFYSPFFNIPGGITIPVFSTIHDVVFLDIKELSGKMGTLIRKWFFQRAYRLSTTLFTVSEFSKERIQHHLGREKDIVVTYCGINDKLKSFHCPEQRLYTFDYILFIGNIKKQKGLDSLLKAYQLSRENGFKHKLVIVGENKHFKTVDADVSHLLDAQKDPDIVYTGWISNDELYTIIKQASLLVQPSRYEGFGIPPLEALYLGCNVLLSDIPVFQEIYTNLPVTFYERDNLVDLSEKIQVCSAQKPVSEEVRTDIDSRYDFIHTSNLIMSQIERTLSGKSKKHN